MLVFSMSSTQAIVLVMSTAERCPKTQEKISIRHKTKTTWSSGSEEKVEKKVRGAFTLMLQQEPLRSHTQLLSVLHMKEWGSDTTVAHMG